MHKVVNFHAQMSSSQSESRTMFFIHEKNDTANQNRKRCFFIQSKPQKGGSFAPKLPPFIYRGLQLDEMGTLALPVASRENVKEPYSRVFLGEK